MHRSIGSRWKNPYTRGIYEVIEHEGNEVNVCAFIGEYKEIRRWYINTEWTYLGDFTKSSNFNNLYDILSRG